MQTEETLVKSNDLEIILDSPIPTSKEECLKEICTDFVNALRYSTLNFWKVGRIIHALQDRGEKKVIEEVMRRTNYEKRAVQYTLAVYKAIPDANKVMELCKKGVEWTHFKELTKIHAEAERKQLMENVLEGKLLPVDIQDTVKDIKKPDTKDTEKHKDKSVVKPVTPNPCSYIEKYKMEADLFRQKLDELDLDYDNMLSIAADENVTSEGTYAKFVGACQEAKEQLEILTDSLQVIIKKIDSDVLTEED
jgi:biopolymer transport protein ExbD